jgi:hypothetical protein
MLLPDLGVTASLFLYISGALARKLGIGDGGLSSPLFLGDLLRTPQDQSCPQRPMGNFSC